MIYNIVILFIVVFKILAAADLLYTVLIVPRRARKLKEEKYPCRSLSLDEHRILKSYYPKETFDGGIWMLEGAHKTAPTMGNWSGQQLINDVPVVLHQSAERYLKRNSHNVAEVAIAKKKAYVVKLNDTYSLEKLEEKVETDRQFLEQWEKGLPGTIVGHEGVTLLGQRDSDKREDFDRAYKIAPLVADGDMLRFVGAFFGITGLILLWLGAKGALGFAAWVGALILALFLISLVLIAMPAYFFSRPIKINKLQGCCFLKSEEELEIGDYKVRIEPQYQDYVEWLMSPGDEVILDVYVPSNIVVRINNSESFVDGVIGAEKEPKTAASTMLVLFVLSSIVLLSYLGGYIHLNHYFSCLGVCLFMALSFGVVLFLKFTRPPAMPASEEK